MSKTDTESVSGESLTRVMGLSDEWRRWVTRLLSSGESSAAVIETLVGAGVPAGIAAREVEILAQVALPLIAQRTRLELVLEALRKTSSGPLEVRSLRDLDDFHARYYLPGRPVLIADGCEALRRSGNWEPDHLIGRFGEIAVRTDVDRDRRPDHYVDPEARQERMPFRALLERLADAPPTNDVYCVSRNRVLEEELAPLRARIRDVPSFLDEPMVPGTVSLWVGPGGTVTPLHHDMNNIYFCQLHGRKRFRLVSPLETELLLGEIHDTFYSDFDLERPGEVQVHDLVLEPGMGLFLPIGWWHRVDALSGSISLSFTGFRRPNEYDEYMPGRHDARMARDRQEEKTS